MSRSSPTGYKEFPQLSALKQTYSSLKALFFDMDGTLFDTEGFHTKAFLKIGADYHVKAPAPLESIHGMLVGKADHLVFEVVKHWEGFPAHWSAADFVKTKNENLLRIIASVPAERFFPRELLNLIQQARSEGMKLALVTSSEKVVTTRLLEMAGLGGSFDFILTRDDCPAHKPDPWPYLKALELSGVSAREALIFEDSDVGLTAAIASGAHVIKAEWYS